MAWLYLLAAGLFEIGWPLGFKLSQDTAVTGNSTSWIIVAVISMAISGFLLYMAQRTIPIGAAYAVWSGIGAVGTFLIGVIMFNDVVSVLGWIGLVFIVSGISMLKVSVLTN